MKPITTIHLAQRLITIETSALATLQDYLDKLKKHFITQESGDEIYTDIENRVSEIMDKKLKAGSVCITDADMEVIKNTVGSLQELGIESATEKENIGAEKNTNNTSEANANTNANSTNADYTNSANGNAKKLTRNANDKILSGLCGGVANYLNVDPAWIRIGFVLAGFFGGIGVIAYILGSIFIPTSNDFIFANKRLMRNTDDKVIGGVCSGLAKYFHTTATNMRLLFLAPVILGIASGMLNIFGDDVDVSINIPFVGIYILLWIILPFASTASEKLQMSGEPVNVNNIKNKVYGTQNNAPNTINRSSTILNIIKAFAFIIIGFISLIFFISFSSVFAAGLAVQPFTEYFFRTGNQQFLAQGSWILIFGLPILVLVALIIRALVGIKGWPKYLLRGAALAFGVGILCAIALATEMKNDFKYESTLAKSEQHTISTDSLLVDLQATKNRDYVTFKNGIFNSLNDSLFLENVDVKIVASLDSNYHVYYMPQASGISLTEANNNAGKINYQTKLEGNKLMIADNYAITKNNLWRNQFITCEIQVPEGKKIIFSEELLDNPFQKFQVQFMSINSYRTDCLQEYDANTTYKMQNGKLVATDTSAKSRIVFSYKNGKDSVELKLKNLNALLDSLGTNKTEIIDKTQEAIDKLQDKLEEINDNLEDNK